MSISKVLMGNRKCLSAILCDWGEMNNSSLQGILQFFLLLLRVKIKIILGVGIEMNKNQRNEYDILNAID